MANTSVNNIFANSLAGIKFSSVIRGFKYIVRFTVYPLKSPTSPSKPCGYTVSANRIPKFRCMYKPPF